MDTQLYPIYGGLSTYQTFVEIIVSMIMRVHQGTTNLRLKESRLCEIGVVEIPYGYFSLNIGHFISKLIKMKMQRFHQHHIFHNV